MTDMKKAPVVKKEKINTMTECKLYKKRWLILAIYTLYSFGNSIQWGEYVIINNRLVKYYDVQSFAIDYTLMSYMIAFVLLIIPALVLLNKMGIRFCLITSSIGICVGSWIKTYAALSPNRFYLVIVGSIVAAVFQVLTYGLSARVTAVWFGPHEVSFACSLAFFGDMFGSALSFLVPMLFVRNTESKTELGIGLFQLNLIISSITTLAALLIIIFFTEGPKQPPSAAQIFQKNTESSFISDVMKNLRSKNFLFIFISYGINNASFNAFSVLINTGLLEFFPDSEKHAGIMSAISMSAGIVGTIGSGWFLDKTHLFKETTIVIYVLSFISMFAYDFMLKSQNLVGVYICTTVFGFSSVTYYSVVIQMTIELTYPVAECVSASMLLAGSHMWGIALTNLYRWSYQLEGHRVANMMLATLLFFGIILTSLIPRKLKRQEIEQSNIAKLGNNEVVKC